MKKKIALTILFCLVASTVLAASVSLQWDPNDPTPEGYRIFMRETGSQYVYSAPKWQGTDTTCTIDGLEEGKTYNFVARAYEGQLESANSVEVTYQVPTSSEPTEYPTQPVNPKVVSDTAGGITISWDGIDGDSYKVFWRDINPDRVAESTYSYDSPAWEGAEKQALIPGLEPGIKYAFVIKAYRGDIASADSQELRYTKATILPPINIPEQPGSLIINFK